MSYEQKHNEANGEDNKDGANDNHSRNWGVEGPTDDHGIKSLRERSMRNMLATLILSQGVPMISHGDEIARFKLPSIDGEGMWLEVVDTAREDAHEVRASEATLEPFSLQLLRFGMDRRVISAPQPAGTEGVRRG